MDRSWQLQHLDTQRDFLEAVEKHTANARAELDSLIYEYLRSKHSGKAFWSTKQLVGASRAVLRELVQLQRHVERYSSYLRWLDAQMR